MNTWPSPPPDAETRTRAWFEFLRDRLCEIFESIEREASEGVRLGVPPGQFIRTSWSRPAEEGVENPGGGVMAVMRGAVFEKVGVNVSVVRGTFSDAFRAEIPGAQEDPRFFATGVSLVAHMRSPRVPAAHMNTRYIRTTRSWFGGGADLTPMLSGGDHAEEFHAALKAACDAHDPEYYERYRAWCDRYFHLPHRNEPRGAGGIFYDRLEGDFERHFAFTREVGAAFADVFPRLVRRSMGEPWSEEEREHQLRKRGRYVEFNLLHDRGTRFGLQTGGNPEAVLMSLPPVVTWR